MYVYYFRTDCGRSNNVLVSKVVGTPKEIEFKYKNFYNVNLDPEGEINKEWIVIPHEEGNIYKRVFWLKSYDLARANQIIDGYNKIKWIKLQKQLRALED